MIRRNVTRMNPFISVLVVAVALSGLGVAHAQPSPQKDIERVIRDFLIAFGNRDYAAFIPYFSEDATVFFPPSAAAPLGRVQGRSEIERTFKTIFDAYPPRSDRPPTPICSAGPADSGVRRTRGSYISIGQRSRPPAAHLRPEAHERRMEDRAPSWIGVYQPAVT